MTSGKAAHTNLERRLADALDEYLASIASTE
jgi:hypothetical protein